MGLRAVLCFLTILVCTHCSIVKYRGQAVYGDPGHQIDTPQNISDLAPESYIAGGMPAGVGQFPWIVRLAITDRKTSSTFRCSGTLISKRHILSAAHCFDHEIEYYSDINIYLGEYNTDSYPMDCVRDKCVQNRLVHPNKIIAHPRYDDKTIANDIALLRLAKAIPTSASIQPIPLPPFNVDHTANDGASVTVAGWGRTETGVTSSILRTTELTLIPRAKCLKLRPSVPPGHLCAGDVTGKDTCPGDSGGPLVMVYKKKYYLAGVVSYGPNEECGEATSGYYTNVYKYMKWIKMNMKV